MPSIERATDKEVKERDRSLRAGRYVVFGRGFERRVSKTSGRDYFNMRWAAINPKDPEARVRVFFAVMSCDLTKEGVCWRWKFLLRAIDCTTSFELGDTIEGTTAEGDENVRKYVLGQPFVAQVGRTESNGYINNDVRSFVPREQWTESELATIEVAKQKWLEYLEKEEEKRVSAQAPHDDLEAPDPFEDDSFDASGARAPSASDGVGDDDFPW